MSLLIGCLSHNSLSFCVFTSYYRVGLDIPTIEVRYQNLKIDAEAFVGSRALPSFVNAATNVIEVRREIRNYSTSSDD
jgi:hypothetical protein